MSDSQRQAERTKQASSQGDFGAAVAVGREAEALFGKGEYAQATRKFMESRDGYDARRAAERAAKAPPSVAPHDHHGGGRHGAATHHHGRGQHARAGHAAARRKRRRR
jgi:hypothetical protein